MILFLVAAGLYAFILVSIRPEPESLKQNKLTFYVSYCQIRASLSIGLLCLLMYFLTSDFTFIRSDREFTAFLSMSNLTDDAAYWPLQWLSSHFVHANLSHLVGNVIALGLTSVYERRVGSRRYLMVLTVSLLVSAFSVFFYSEPVRVCGISGGVFGLGAAYVTDHKQYRFRDWLYAIAFFALFMLYLSLPDSSASAKEGVLAQNVDLYGHLLGAAGAIIYCRIRPASH